MRAMMVGGAVLAATMLVGCSDTTAPTTAADDTDYALVAFGSAGGALEGTLGPQGDRPYDGRTGGPPLPAELQLTDEQRAEIAALRNDFKTTHQADLDALRAIFEQARAAREAGATREEVRAILATGRPIMEALRPAVHALHLAILAVLTDEQRAWLDANRRRLPDGLPLRLGGPGHGRPPRP
jgi:Spy/CpxP family protein refolding chaperone